MGYLYDRLRDALGGNKFSKSHGGIVNDWTPNNVRCLVLGKDYIFIAYHTKNPRVFELDSNMVSDELSRPVTGSLHNLLSNRQLSCMEEIYVDYDYEKRRDLIDLVGYVKSLANSASRLRFYGYGRFGFNSNILVDKYTNARMNSYYTYSYSLDKNRDILSYMQVEGNNYWYKKHYLRPQYYKLDSENGDLARYFRMCEDKIGEALSKLEFEEKESCMLNKLKHCVESDDLYTRDLDTLVSFLSKPIKGNLIQGILVDAFNKEISDGFYKKYIVGKEILEKCLIDCKNKQLLVKLYSNLGIVGRENEVLSDEELDLVYKTGLFRVEELTDRILYNSYNKIIKQYPDYLLVIRSVVSNVWRIPEGLFSKAIKYPITGGGGYYELLNVLFGICGWSPESYYSYMNRGK